MDDKKHVDDRKHHPDDRHHTERHHIDVHHTDDRHHHIADRHHTDDRHHIDPYHIDRHNIDEKKYQVYKQSKLEAEHISLVASDPSLKGRITINIVEPDGTVYWYIRFNTLLDEATVCKKTMNITDTKGYILNSLITYDATRNLIILNPMDLYRPNENYILNISKKVRSLSGKYLKKPVHIMFKLVNNKMTEFEILKSTAEVPKPRKKPHSVKREEIKELMDARAIAAGKERVSKKNEVKPTLPYGTIGIKIHLSAIGLLLMVASLFTQNTNIILGGMALAVLGLAHVLLQLRKKTVLSSLNYAFGVSRFNKGNYQQAQKLFERAITQDPRNDLAEYAADKVEHYV